MRFLWIGIAALALTACDGGVNSAGSDAITATTTLNVCGTNLGTGTGLSVVSASGSDSILRYGDDRLNYINVSGPGCQRGVNVRVSPKGRAIIVNQADGRNGLPVVVGVRALRPFRVFHLVVTRGGTTETVATLAPD
jgi:hypothetical protein